MIKRIPWRAILAVTILLATFALFVDYFISHPEVRQQLGQTSLLTFGLLLGLYGVFVLCLTLINIGTLRLCNTTIRASESLLLSMYSSVVNFFGPLQSGPAFRAVYLKQKHGVKLADYTAASIVYYMFYALFSGIFLLSGILGWWLLPATGLLIAIFVYLRRTERGIFGRLHRLALGRWHYLAIATLAQVSILAVIYYVELRTVAPGTTVGQAIIYTGAANFALFVSITPGAIGFRESFLLFTERLHNVDASTIVAANTLDRAVYIVFLIIVATVIFSTHASRRFKLQDKKN